MENRLDLIEFNTDYLDDLYEYSSQEDFYKYMQSKPHKSVAETEEYFLTKSVEEGTYLFLVKNVLEKKVIGSIIINKLDKLNLSANIGYGLNPKYWGNGYLKEMLLLAEKKAKEDLYIHRLEAVTMTINIPSIGGLKSCDYKQVGVIKGYYLFSDNKRYDASLFSKIL
tara:strand:+ start:1894 stop:2397 length:504 start_codon:yes stop_codon:yes gene_type:complete